MEVNVNPEIVEGNDTKKQKIRNYPMPKQINYFMLQNYGYDFYGAKIYSEKVKILAEINEKLRSHGFTFSESEIERRLKNMKSHYRRKKEDIEMGIIKKTDWEYYDLLHAIFTEIAKKNETEATTLLNERLSEMAAHASNQSQSANIPQAHQVKRKCDFIKEEKVEFNNSGSEDSEISEPLDMSAKKMKILEFNNIKDITNQIPSSSDNSINDKKDDLIRIIENLKVVDQARLALDEQRLKLEIRRNELDKLGYQLSDQLCKLINS